MGKAKTLHEMSIIRLEPNTPEELSAALEAIMKHSLTDEETQNNLEMLGYLPYTRENIRTEYGRAGKGARPVETDVNGYGPEALYG